MVVIDTSQRCIIQILDYFSHNSSHVFSQDAPPPPLQTPPTPYFPFFCFSTCM